VRFSSPFDILKKIGVATVEYVEVVRDFQTAAARKLKLFAKSLSQTGGVNVYPAVRVESATVFDEAKLLELIHKKIDARACSANHRCQGPLRYSRETVQLAPVRGPCEQQKCAGEPPLTAVRNLID
jgi:hypothetical protein